MITETPNAAARSIVHVWRAGERVFAPVQSTYPLARARGGLPLGCGSRVSRSSVRRGRVGGRRRGRCCCRLVQVRAVGLAAVSAREEPAHLGEGGGERGREGPSDVCLENVISSWLHTNMAALCPHTHVLLYISLPTVLTHTCIGMGRRRRITIQFHDVSCRQRLFDHQCKGSSKVMRRGSKCITTRCRFQEKNSEKHTLPPLPPLTSPLPRKFTVLGARTGREDSDSPSSPPSTSSSSSLSSACCCCGRCSSSLSHVLDSDSAPQPPGLKEGSGSPPHPLLESPAI